MPVEPTNGNLMALTIFVIIAIIVYMFISRYMALLKKLTVANAVVVFAHGGPCINKSSEIYMNFTGHSKVCYW